MKIVFKFSNGKNKLISFDQEFVIHDNDCGETKIYDKNFQKCPAILTMIWHEALIFKTAWSGFEYTLNLADNTAVYEGARRGFLNQNILPNFGKVEILSAEGTYGSFRGKNALNEYSTLSKNDSVLNSLISKIWMRIKRRTNL